MYRYFKCVSGFRSGNCIQFQKSKELSDENTTAPTTSDNKLNPELSFFGNKKRVKFNGRCSKQDKITYDHHKVVKICIVYQISTKNNISDYLTLEDYLVQLVDSEC